MVSSVKSNNLQSFTCYIYTRFCSISMGYKKFRGKSGYVDDIFKTDSPGEVPLPPMQDDAPENDDALAAL